MFVYASLLRFFYEFLVGPAEKFLFFCHTFLSVLDHSLSKMCIFGFRPLYLSVFCITLYSIVRSFPTFYFVGSTMMAFESCSYAAIIYLHPLADVTGNRPVWSVYILDENYITEKNTWCNRVQSISSSYKTFVGITICCSFFSLIGTRSLLDFGSLLSVLIGFSLGFSLGSSDGIVVAFSEVFVLILFLNV